MIAVGETTAEGREVPFQLPTSSNPLVGLTAHAWTDAGGGVTSEVQILLPGSVVWQDATIANIVEKGYGTYALQLTAVQVATAGVVYIRVVVTGAQPYTGSEVIGVTGGDISVSGDGYVPFFLPDATDPVNGTPITGHVFSAGEVKVCLPGGSYVNATVADIVEAGYGAYALKLTAASSQTTTRGKAYIHVDIGTSSQPYDGYVTILGAATVTVQTVVQTSNLSPVVSPYSPSSPSYTDHAAEALKRLCEQFRAKAA